MLQSISWSDFFTAVAVLVTLYYLFSVAVFYQKDFVHYLKNRGKSSQSDSDTTSMSDNIMGATHSEQHVPREERIAPEDVQIISKRDDSEQTDSDSLLVGTVSDLLQEIRLLNENIQLQTKDELVPVFRELLAKYPKLINTQYQEAINLFIVNASQESGKWEFDSVEVESLWPSTAS